MATGGGYALPRLKSFRASGVTDGSGNVTFDMTAAGFSAVPIVSSVLFNAPTDATECRVTAISATSVTFNARRAPGVIILGIGVLGAAVAASGVTVNVLAFPAGSQV